MNKSGICVGADSRSSNMEHGVGTPVYAYIDSTEKIFRYKNIFFQIGGASDYTHYTIFGLFDEFKKHNQKAVNVHTYWPIFCQYAKTIMGDSEYNTFKNGVDCIISGYENSKPYAYFYSRDHKDSMTNEGFISSNRLENKKVNLKNFLDTAHVESMIALIKRIINIEAKSYKNGISPIGGPSSVGYVTREGKIYEDFQKKHSHKTVLEGMKAAFNDETDRVYRSPQDSIIFKNSIKYHYLH
ncbi:hypothetical protein GCM10011511_56300 [Puia dinghuensis]|uniref:Uncharacterized protein n=2 Tax=Puia dinghuensis TaxID=1792502 RepID=A0A8J2XWB6_9BACT|nr:hypothetical protein GCM10011511_56300 [Puia dinghuensis]